jgi:hypothetical protein
MTVLSLTFVHDAPLSADRKSVPCVFVSVIRYTTLGLLGAIATPGRSIGSVGRPLVSFCHVSPPSVVL